MSETIEPYAVNARHLDGSTKNGDGALYLNYNQQDKPIYMNGGNTAIHSGNIGTYLANKLTIEDAPQNTDMNTITSSKIVGITYTEGTNQTNLHTPLGETTSGYSTVSYYNVETISFASGYRLCQVAWSCFSHNSGMWYRTKHDANWSAWKKILTEVDLSTIDTNQTGDIVYSVGKPLSSYLLCNGQTIESTQYPALINKIKYQYPSEFSTVTATTAIGNYTERVNAVWWQELNAFIICCFSTSTDAAYKLYKYMPTTNTITQFADVPAIGVWTEDYGLKMFITSSGHLCLIQPNTSSSTYYYTVITIFNTAGAIVYRSIFNEKINGNDLDNLQIYYNPSNNYIYGLIVSDPSCVVFYAGNNVNKGKFAFTDNISVYGDVSGFITGAGVIISDTYTYSDGSLRKYYLSKYVFGIGKTDLSESTPLRYMNFFGTYNADGIILAAQTGRMVPQTSTDPYKKYYPTYDQYFYLYNINTNKIDSTIQVAFSVNEYDIERYFSPTAMPALTNNQLYGITNTRIVNPGNTYLFKTPLKSITKDRHYGITLSVSGQTLTITRYDLQNAIKTTLPKSESVNQMYIKI